MYEYPILREIREGQETWFVTNMQDKKEVQLRILSCSLIA